MSCTPSTLNTPNAPNDQRTVTSKPHKLLNEPNTTRTTYAHEARYCANCNIYTYKGAKVMIHFTHYLMERKS